MVGGTDAWAWSSVMGDAAALEEAVALGELVESLWSEGSEFGCLLEDGCTEYGLRLPARHVLFVTRLAEVTGDTRWAVLRDRMVAILLDTPDWDPEHGMYFQGEWPTDETLGEGAFIEGARLQAVFSSVGSPKPSTMFTV